MQHYVMKFVSDLQLVCSLLCVLRFPPPINIFILQLGILYLCFAEI
jgi:hypothetical protein